MSEKKSNKKMSANRTVKIKKMSARVSNWLYLKAKFIADAQGITMEQKITELLRKDIQYVSTQKWFIEYLQEEENQDFNTFGVPPNQQKRGGRTKFVEPEDDSDDSDGSDFNSNNVNGDGHEKI